MAHHGTCCGDPAHHRDPNEIGINYSLFTKIDKEHLECLNESVEGAGKTVFKPWEERLNFENVSDKMKPCRDCHHDHEHDEEVGIHYSLYSKIDKEKVQCLNETVENSGKQVFKPWEERLSLAFVESDADEELLFNIPFVGNIKLKAIKIIGEDSDTHPSKMRLFKNRPSMTFDDVTAQADQEFELVKDTSGIAEYTTKVVTFNNVNHLTLHFPTNFGAEATRIYYIGLKGEFYVSHHHGVTICTYESRPMAEDVKNPLNEFTPARLGQ